jgi:hypothetical protein
MFSETLAPMQDVLAILIALAAVAFLAYRTWQRFTRRRSGECGACLSCGANDALKSKPLVTIAPMISHTANVPRDKGRGVS